MALSLLKSSGPKITLRERFLSSNQSVKANPHRDGSDQLPSGVLTEQEAQAATILELSEYYAETRAFMKEMAAGIANKNSDCYKPAACATATKRRIEDVLASKHGLSILDDGTLVPLRNKSAPEERVQPRQQRSGP